MIGRYNSDYFSHKGVRLELESRFPNIIRVILLVTSFPLELIFILLMHTLMNLFFWWVSIVFPWWIFPCRSLTRVGGKVDQMIKEDDKGGGLINFPCGGYIKGYSRRCDGGPL